MLISQFGAEPATGNDAFERSAGDGILSLKDVEAVSAFPPD
jgi:hypothetical protein